ncbi:MAG TPA: hypothetical protein VGQ83_11960 [Polyangia bacterium]|jgi:hypothetical protein
MLDVFDLVLPPPVLPACATRCYLGEYPPANAALPRLCAGRCYVGEVPLGEVAPWQPYHRAVFGDLADPSSLAVVACSRLAVRAAKGEVAAWKRYLDAVQALLRERPGWRAVLEASCDQHPLARVSLTPKELVAAVDRQQSHPVGDLALLVCGRE